MKIKNVKFTAIAYHNNTPSTLRMFCTEKALSNWANTQYRKDNNCIIEVFKGTSIEKNRLYCTYSA